MGKRTASTRASAKVKTKAGTESRARSAYEAVTASSRADYEALRDKLVRTLRRAGRSERSIAATLGNVTRKRTEIERARSAAARKGWEKRREVEQARSVAARKGWETRRQAAQQKLDAQIRRLVDRIIRTPAPRKPNEIAKNKRALEALRELLQKRGRSKEEIRTILSRLTYDRKERYRDLAGVKAVVLGREGVTGRRREDWYLLRLHVRGTDAFKAYLAEAYEHGLSEREAVDFWFSPEAFE
jgi:hypothetical protein